MSRFNNPFERGTTRSATDRPHLLGQRCYFDNVVANTGNGPTKVTDGREVEAIVVKNDSGGTLAAKKAVTWKAGYTGTRVGGVTSGASQRVAGIVDPFLTSTVADGEQFLLIVKGPTTVLANDGSITAGTGLVSQAAGRAGGYAANGDSDDALSYFGTADAASSAQDDDVAATIDCRY
ncbi:MAG: hypothetical protein CMK32_08065 [Porticoccaceae bacterium]|nr:hypothetical protein [Porticoccaceae bacterium]